VRRADGYYAQFALDVKVTVETEPTGQAIGLDVGLTPFPLEEYLFFYEPQRTQRALQAKER